MSGEVVLWRDGTTVELRGDDGGKLVRLRRGGVEWLAPSTPREPGGAYAGGGGWDECIPTIAACTTPDGRTLRDHGEAWRSAWAVTSASGAAATMVAELGDGLRLERETRIADGGAVSLGYAVSTTGADRRVHWAAHPLFDAPARTRLEYATARAQRWICVGATARPSDGRIDAVASGTAVKSFAQGVRRVGVVRPNGHRLTLGWSSPLLPAVGLYWDNGLFLPGRAVVAVEPTTAAADGADEVWERLPVVRRDAPLEWRVDVTFSRD